MKLALAQVSPRLGDNAANLRLHRDLIRRSRRQGASLAVFPELALNGYNLQDMVRDVAESASGGRSLKGLAAASKGSDVITGFVEDGGDGDVYNAAGWFSRGKLRHVHRKVHLPTYGMFDEGRDFGAGESFRTFQAPWGRTGILICEDFWHLAASWILSVQGMDLLVVISASPLKGMSRSRRPASLDIWEDLGRVVAKHSTCWVAYVNRVGCEDGWVFQGGSFLCAPDGKVTARAGFMDEELLVAEMDPGVLRRARIRSPLKRGERPDLIRRELGRILGEER